MSDFHFKDEDDDLGLLPSVQEPEATPPTVPLKPTPPTQNTTPQIPSPTAPQNRVASSVPSPSAPPPSAFNLAPSPDLPQIPSPAPPKIPIAPSAANANSPKVPSPIAPVSAPKNVPAANALVANPAVANAQNVNAPKAVGNAQNPTSSTRSAAPVSKSAAPATNANTPANAVNTAANTTPKAAPKPGIPTPIVPETPLPPLTETSFAGELERRQLTTSAKPKVENVHLSLWYRVLDVVQTPAAWVLRIATIAGGLALLYLLWGILSGALARDGNSALVVGNVGVAVNIFRISLFAAAVSLLLLMWEERFVAPVIVVLGFLLTFGTAPILQGVGSSKALATIVVALSLCGRALIILGFIKFCGDLMMWIVELPNRMRVRADVGVSQQAEPRQQREAQNANMFSPCWKLPFCREVIRKQCPAYLAKATCWKFGRGCYCDEEMISRIIRGESLDNIKAPTRMSRQSKPPCHRCYIFLEHQGLKYKVFSPLAVPATIGIVYFAWPTYLKLTGNFGDSLNFVWNRLAFSGGPSVSDLTSKVAEGAGTASSTLTPMQVQAAAQNMFGVLLGFYLLIVMSKGIEWAIYKARL